MPDDKIQREIEDILSRLDDFVPEESVTSRMRRRSSDAAATFVRALISPIAGISLRQVMLTALILVVVGFVGMRIHPLFGRWVLIGGVILFLTTFALSFFSRSSTVPPATQKRWRGQPMNLNEPSLGDRVRAWLQAKRRPRY
ncbi:MAG: hypothetical protein WD939_05735 [Dehalococcoidia bacterium]